MSQKKNFSDMFDDDFEVTYEEEPRVSLNDPDQVENTKRFGQTRAYNRNASSDTIVMSGPYQEFDDEDDDYDYYDDSDSFRDRYDDDYEDDYGNRYDDDYEDGYRNRYDDDDYEDDYGNRYDDDYEDDYDDGYEDDYEDGYNNRRNDHRSGNRRNNPSNDRKDRKSGRNNSRSDDRYSDRYDDRYDDGRDSRKKRSRRRSGGGVPLAAPIKQGGKALSHLTSFLLQQLSVILIIVTTAYVLYNFWRASTPYGDIAEAIKTQKISRTLAAYVAVAGVYLFCEFISLLWTMTRVRVRNGMDTWREDTGRGFLSFIMVFVISYICFLFSPLLPDSPDIVYGVKGALDVYGSLHNGLLGLCAAGAVSCLIRRYKSH